LARDPKNGHLLNNLGSLHAKNGRFAEARGYYQRALACFPDTPEILSNLMTMHRAMGEHAAALTLVPRVMNLYRPGAAIFPVYNCAKMFCLWEEAADLLPKIEADIAADRTTIDAFVEFNLALLATPGVRPETHFEVHQKAARLINQHRVAPPFKDYPKAMRRTGRLKIGYISPDFHRHVSNICFRGLMNFHDKDLFEITCYSNSNIEDEISAQYRAAADHFINVSGLSDEALAARIHDDGVHFLIDLAGYTTNGRLGVLSYRPAPVQMMYLGYPYTSGSAAVDYFIADPYLNGPENARYFSERMLCLPESFISFSGFKNQPIDPIPPHEKNGHITFGSMNNLYKINPELIAVWSRILKETPGSTMIINHPNCSEIETRDRIRAAFQMQGIHPERIKIVWDTHPKGSHFYYYNDIDIILDSFPMTGGTTTIDAAWMGVPVITKAGEIYPHRLSYSILKNIGIDVDPFIASSDAEYVAKAVALAEQPEWIAALRREIPAALSQSILTDPLKLTRQMEEAYIRGWNKKYPDQAISRKIKDQTVRYVSLAGEVEIAVRDSVEDLETYVLREQQGWFDPEYHFVQRVIQPGAAVLDMGAGMGSYAVPLASKAGPEGRVVAVTRSEMDAQYLHYSKMRNALAQLDVISECEDRFDFNPEKTGRSFSDFDFIRISTSEPVRGLLSRGAAFLKSHAPLIMFCIKSQENVIQTEAHADFKKLGYEIYRFVPGPGVLVPFSSPDELDAFALNLFACKAERADILEKQGLLIQKAASLSQMPGLEDTAWQSYLASFPYAKPLAAHWLGDAAKCEAWENYWIALNLYAQSREPRRPAPARYAALNAAFGLLIMLSETAVNLPRILTLIRVMLDLGKRETAVHFMNQVVSLFESGDPVEINEPFAPLSDADAVVDPKDRFGEWLFAAVLKRREESRAFSTCFSGESALPVFETIRETPFYSDETDRLLTLIRSRFPGMVDKKDAPRRVSAC
ncbi:MAG: tetratricopeptide repeat protein, partial [Nitrospiria bacterium]